MGEIKVGDTVYDERGEFCRVTATTDIEDRSCSKIIFDDRSEIVASNEHEWPILSGNIRHKIRGRVGLNSKNIDWRKNFGYVSILETQQLRSKSEKGGYVGRPHAIPTSRPLVGFYSDVINFPYTLGMWLGDGTTVDGSITIGHQDEELIISNIKGEGIEIRRRPSSKYAWGTRRLAVRLRELGVLGNKHIPITILRSDLSTRLSVLQGIVDSDGHLEAGQGEYEIQICNKKLADDIADLVATFGWKVYRATQTATLYGKDCGLAYRIRFRPDMVVSRLPRKKCTNRPSQGSQHTIRMVCDIIPVGKQQVRCIEVDSYSHMFLAGNGLIPTHNSYIAARIACWFLACHPHSLVLTTAPTDRQVRGILWKEIGQTVVGSKIPFGGNLNTQELRLGRDWFAIGFTAPDWDPTRFQGWHAEDILVIVDEACGVTDAIMTGIDGVMSSAHSRKLSIGNPTDPMSAFARDFKRPGVSKIYISAFDSPNFEGLCEQDFVDGSWETKRRPIVNPALVTPEWAARMLVKWGVDSPLWTAKVRGQFPEQSDDTLIPLSWIDAAQHRDLPPEKKPAVELACDVARSAQGDETVIMLRRGNSATCVWAVRGQDIVATSGKLIEQIRETGANIAKVDGDGIGAGVVDVLKSNNAPVYEIRSGMPPNEPERFVNLRAEWYWTLRERFHDGDISIDEHDEELAGQLAQLKYKLDGKGRIAIEAKDEMRKRGISSPDRADCLAYLFAPVTNLIRDSVSSLPSRLSARYENIT